MSLRQLIGSAYVLITERMTEEVREAFDRQLAGLSLTSPRRAREGQAQLIGAMELARR